MALTETRPETQPAQAEALDGEAVPTTLIDGVFGSGDHKTIGRLWIGAGALMTLVALVVSLVSAIELIDLEAFAIFDDGDQLTQAWSLGRDLLLFGGLVPIFVGLATFIVPLQVGSPSIAFPRGASAAFWSWFVATDVLILSYLVNGGPAGGKLDFSILWVLALGTMVVSIGWALICIATTVLAARTTGMSLERVPAATWSFLVFSVIGLFALPILAAELVIAYLDLRYGFLPDKASRAGLVEIMNGVTAAPAVYWLGVPVLGIAVDAIGVHTGRPVRFHKPILAAIGVFGFMAFGADFFSFDFRGRMVAADNGMLVVALLAVMLPILATLALAGESMGKGKPKVTTPLAAGLLGGLLLLATAGVALAAVVDPIIGFIETLTGNDITVANKLEGTTFNEGIRAMMMGVGLLGAIAGVHHWGHKIWGYAPEDRLGLLTVLAAAGGTVLWGAGNVAAGFFDQLALPAANSNPDDILQITGIVSVVGVALLALSGVLLVLNILGAAAGRLNGVEPWTGATLEWATDSPPAPGNFPEMPIVASATPLADLAADKGDS